MTPIELALEALYSTGESDGYHGVTQYYDEAKVEAAIEALEKELAQQDLLRKAATKAIEVLEGVTNYPSWATWSPSMTKECQTTAHNLREALAQEPPQLSTQANPHQPI